MKRILFLFGLVLVGCDEGKYSNKSFIIDHTETYFIPDSNKQKYADFVSKSTSGCDEDCRWYLEDVVKEGGKIYGTEIVNVKVRRHENSKCNRTRNCFDSVLLKSELTDEMIETTKNYFIKEN
jgi:hypothetical protein